MLLPTTQAWPQLSASLEALLVQEAAPPFEILLLDGHGQALPGEHSSPLIRWLRLPGKDTFALRAAGIAAARGAIIALSEDHCITPPNWVASIAAAHRENPAPVLVGATINHAASAISPMDRANFLLTFAGQNQMRLDLTARRLPVPTNLSFKRDVFPAEGFRSGELEYRWLAQLNTDGAISVARSVELLHRQCWGVATPGVHFASGRSFGATVRDAPRRDRLHWWSSLPLLPLRLAKLVFPDLVHGAAGARPSLAEVFCVITLIAANVTGQAMGALLGPGASRQRL